MSHVAFPLASTFGAHIFGGETLATQAPASGRVVLYAISACAGELFCREVLVDHEALWAHYCLELHGHVEDLVDLSEDQVDGVQAGETVGQAFGLLVHGEVVALPLEPTHHLKQALKPCLVMPFVVKRIPPQLVLVLGPC